MDPLTHAASGAVAMLAFARRPSTRLAAPLAAIVCASPDIDLALIRTPPEFLMLHRGITHSFAFMPFFALPLAALCWPLWRNKTPCAWKFYQVWLFCCAMILLHIWMDVVTTYGTMVFLPFSHYRVRLNSLYIIDAAILLPLLYAIFFWRKKPRLQAAVLLWIFLFPAAGILINHWHQSQLSERLRMEGRAISELHILPDAFAPFFWRAIFREENNGKETVRSLGLNWLGEPHDQEEIFPAANERIMASLESDSLEGDVFFHFAMLPVMETLPRKYLPVPAPKNFQGFLFYDLRFGSNIPWVRKLLSMRPNSELPFLFMAELPDYGKQGAMDNSARQIRLRFADSGKDSGWHKPSRPEPPGFLQWLAGLGGCFHFR